MLRVAYATRFSGPLAQLGERLICIQEVSGSIPLGSTNIRFANEMIGISDDPMIGNCSDHPII